MIGHSLPEYVFIRLSILGLRLIAPSSLAYLTFSWYDNHWIFSKWLGYYAIVESLFYLCIYLPRSWLLQQHVPHPAPLTRAERELLFSKCFATARDTELATGWFFSSPSHAIRRDNVVEWILWALFSTRRDANIEEWEEEIESYVKIVERLMGRKLEDGLNKEIKCMKVTLDPVVSLHRPLVWYIIVWIVDAFTFFHLELLGFRHHSISNWYSYFPPRLISPLCRPSTHPRVSYWYRPHRSKTEHPILFIHGIGIGLWPYTPFLAEIAKRHPDVGIIAIENLSISMRISPPPMARTDMLQALLSVLDAHNFQRVVVCGHSYGTVVAAHMLRDPQIAPRVAGWAFIDPIPFLLHLPAVAYNFVYRKPKTANEWQLWYFASRDPDISRALARHFFWTENVLWKEDLKGLNVGVALSGRDQIVDSEEVRKYLTGEAEPNARWESENGKLEVLWYPDCDHATIFDARARRAPLHQMLDKLMKIEDSSVQARLCESDEE